MKIMQNLEEKTRKNFIVPALKQAGWNFETQILEEEPYSGVEKIKGWMNEVKSSLDFVTINPQIIYKNNISQNLKNNYIKNSYFFF